MKFFEDLLEIKCKLEGTSDYYTQWFYDKKVYKSILNGVNESYPNFTDHGESHSISILVNIYRMFGKDYLESLSSFDIWLLLEASYLHDCGMFIPLDKVEKIISSEEFKDYFISIRNNPFHEMNIYAKNFSIENNEIKYSVTNYNPTLELSMKYIISSFKRSTHAYEHRDILGENERKLLPIRIYLILNLIVDAHSYSFEDVLKLPKKETGIGAECGHPRFVAYLLRMGDLLDIDNNRMDYIETRGLSKKIPRISEYHFEKHKSITHYRIDQEKIEISALIDCGVKNYEIAEITDQWFKMIENEYSNLLHSWKKIIPKNFNGSLPILGKLKIKIKDYEYIDSKDKPKFSIELEDISEILMGESIYRNKEVALREIIQNSIDATYLRVYEESVKPLKDIVKNREKIFKDKNIIININHIIDKSTEDRNCWEIKIRDFGIGINKEKLKYILTSGSSYKDSKKNKIIEKMPNVIKPSGNFGIGFQSIFLLTDEVTINSKSLYTQENIEVDLFKPSKKNSVYFKKNNFDYKKKIGTEISFKYFTDKGITPRRSRSRLKKFELNYKINFDPLVAKEFDSEIMSIIDTINETNRHSLIDIILYKNKERIALSKNNLLELKSNDDDKFQISLSQNEDMYYFKNQYINASGIRSFYFLKFKVNIVGFEAREILEINRSRLKDTFHEKYSKDLREAITKYVYINYIKGKKIEKIDMNILCFYCLYEEMFAYLKIDEDEKSEIFKRVMNRELGKNKSIKELLLEKKIEIIERTYRGNITIKDSKNEALDLSTEVLRLILKFLIDKNYYKMEVIDDKNDIIELIKVDSKEKEKINLKYEVQDELLKLNEPELGRVTMIYDGTFDKLRLKEKQEKTKLEKLIESNCFDIDNDVIYYLSRLVRRNLILHPFFIKEDYYIWNKEIKEKYIEFCFKNRYEINTTKEMIEDDLDKFVNYLKDKLGNKNIKDK